MSLAGHAQWSLPVGAAATPRARNAAALAAASGPGVGVTLLSPGGASSSFHSSGFATPTGGSSLGAPPAALLRNAALLAEAEAAAGAG